MHTVFIRFRLWKTDQNVPKKYYISDCIYAMPKSGHKQIENKNLARQVASVGFSNIYEWVACQNPNPNQKNK